MADSWGQRGRQSRPGRPWSSDTLTSGYPLATQRKYSRRVASISDTRVREFLQHGTRTGKLGYTSANGRPLVAPIWFILDGDDVVFNTGKDTAKGTSIARDPRVTLCVDFQQPPYAFVQVQGEAVTSEDPDELLRTAIAVAERYMSPDRAEEFGRRNAVEGELVIRLRPAKVLAEFDMTG